MTAQRTADRLSVSARDSLIAAYDVDAAKRRLVEDAQHMPRPQEIRRPRINTFTVYDPNRPINPRRPAQATPEPDVYTDAPEGESFWLMLVGGLGLCFFLWLLLWVVSL